MGNTGVRAQPFLGLICSVRCPGNVILQTYDLAKALRDAAVPVAGGFHSPMEKECLDRVRTLTRSPIDIGVENILAGRLTIGLRAEIHFLG